jgi:hypothetical protein
MGSVFGSRRRSKDVVSNPLYDARSPGENPLFSPQDDNQQDNSSKKGPHQFFPRRSGKRAAYGLFLFLNVAIFALSSLSITPSLLTCTCCMFAEQLICRWEIEEAQIETGGSRVSILRWAPRCLVEPAVHIENFSFCIGELPLALIVASRRLQPLQKIVCEAGVIL